MSYPSRFAAFLTCAAVVATPGQVRAQADRVQSDTALTAERFFGGLARAAERVAGLPDMPNMGTGRTREREIRIYAGLGMFPPDRFVRIWRGSDGVVRGLRGVAWRREAGRFRILGSAEAAARLRHQEEQSDSLTRAYVLSAYRCSAVREDSAALPGYLACLLPPTVPGPARSGTPATRRPIDWADVLRGLDSLGIDTLPPQGPRRGTDGITMLVTVRDSAGARAYSYWSPSTNDPDAATRHAAEILRRLRRLFPDERPKPAPAPSPSRGPADSMPLEYLRQHRP